MFTVVAATEPVEEIVTVLAGGFDMDVVRDAYETVEFAYVVSLFVGELADAVWGMKLKEEKTVRTRRSSTIVV